MNITMKLLPLALLALSQSLLAQQLPGAGSQLKQVPAPPEVRKSEPEMRIEEATTPTVAGADTVRVLVTRLEISGARVYTEAELIAIAGFTPGVKLTLSQLQAMAARITEHYRANGYFVARAYLPAQDISDNVVTVAVSEGNYGEVILRNQTNLADGLANGLLGGLESGEAIELDPLESRLLLLSDVPGVELRSTLVPGTVPGSSDLIVELTPGQRVTGSIHADNAGNPYTGEYRLGASVNLNNPLGRGDVASLHLLTSGSGLQYGRASYQMQFGRATAGIAYSRLDYELGEQFESLGADGTAEVASIFGAYPLVRSRDTNLYLGLAAEDRTFQDRIDLVPSVTDREARVWTPSLYGNRQDGFGGGGYSTFILSYSRGSLDILTPAALAADAASARTNGSYGRLWFNATRQQRVTDRLSLHASFSAQRASQNLDPSEKMVLGGIAGVRAYPQGEGFGDEGYLATLEGHLLLAGWSERIPGQVHVLGFVDGGRITVDKDPWFAGDNHRTLSGAGIGATWSESGSFAVRTYYAVKLGSEDAISAPDKSGRFWIQAVKHF
ncbi:ShlB/FhaC/HecB family hemolysin secretion/activation protein [Luteimonas sp. RD2P54]|uniref:ShlB/FhaC/HecB family hemolysin secretion/activation protein n=1 Tax=Luteimonas endophytica TaxID=3042023 RepID=A0ABT6J6M5_9GAMM|nr:ShlB/FhaC/HecB family hemolysin secretion/activation protein [Luteimonas endophytica]MDH5822456.1 ShlB/FhaC/HecB family hemolysin secretion/activation protein [Luteimonas endophytica]